MVATALLDLWLGVFVSVGQSFGGGTSDAIACKKRSHAREGEEKQGRELAITGGRK